MAGPSRRRVLGKWAEVPSLRDWKMLEPLLIASFVYEAFVRSVKQFSETGAILVYLTQSYGPKVCRLKYVFLTMRPSNMFSREVWLCPMLFVLCKLNCMVHGYRSEDSEFKRFAERKDQARWRTPDGIVEDLSRLGSVVVEEVGRLEKSGGLDTRLATVYTLEAELLCRIGIPGACD